MSSTQRGETESCACTPCAVAASSSSSDDAPLDQPSNKPPPASPPPPARPADGAGNSERAT